MSSNKQLKVGQLYIVVSSGCTASHLENLFFERDKYTNLLLYDTILLLDVNETTSTIFYQNKKMYIPNRDTEVFLQEIFG